MKGKFIIITGPSASGKTALTKALIERLPNASRLVTMTTRSPRNGEANGKDYFFIDRATFEQKIKEQDFFEYAEVYGNLYGSSKTVLADFLKKYDYVVAVIDVQGAKTLKAHISDSITLFINPGSIETIIKRLKAERKEVSKEETDKRIAIAEHELSLADQFDAVIVNKEGEFDKTIQETLKIIQNK